MGWEADESAGNGSHIKMTWPRNGKSFPIRHKFSKVLLSVMLKQVEEYSGITWDDIDKVR